MARLRWQFRMGRGEYLEISATIYSKRRQVRSSSPSLFLLMEVSRVPLQPITTRGLIYASHASTYVILLGNISPFRLSRHWRTNNHKQLCVCLCIVSFSGPSSPIVVVVVNGLCELCSPTQAKSLSTVVSSSSTSSTMPAPFAHGQQPAAPALYLYPLNDSFVPKHIALLPQQRVKIGRQTNAKTVPAERNGYFDSKVLSRQHAEVWEQDGKVIPNLFPLSPLGTRG